MSDHSVSVVRLDRLTPSQAQSLAEAVRDWLLAREVIAVNDERDELWAPSEWKPGPGARDVVGTEWFESLIDDEGNGVDINPDWGEYNPMENFSPPDCPSCSAPGPEDYTNAEWLERWVDEGDEPEFTCAVCGRTALAGDWVGEFSLVVGAPGVTFNNWPELSEEFMKELKLRLGGRIAVVREHI